MEKAQDSIFTACMGRPALTIPTIAAAFLMVAGLDVRSLAHWQLSFLAPQRLPQLSDVVVAGSPVLGCNRAGGTVAARLTLRQGGKTSDRTAARAMATMSFFASGIVAWRRVSRRRVLLLAKPKAGAKERKKKTQFDLFKNSFKLMVAELPGPWEQWREQCRAQVIRDIDLVEAAKAEEEAPLNSVTEERRRALGGKVTEQSQRFKQVKHAIKLQKTLGHLPVLDRRRVVIIGAGPSGYTAAMYTARARLRPLLFCGPLTGGQLMLTSDIENFPGYPEAVSGPQMMDDLRRQAERFGAEIHEKFVECVDFSQKPFRLKLGYDDGVIEADSIIIATGATARWLNAPEEEYVKGNGISTCAVCDGALYGDEDVAVVGGGDTALEDALFLSRFASSVTLIHRRDEFSASALMLERVEAEPKITIKRCRQVSMWLHDGNTLTGAMLEDPGDPTVTEELKISGAFVAIGHVAQSQLFKGQLATDQDGYILHSRPGSSTMTSIPGVFSCGDVSDRRYRQAITAAGHGCQAALDAERWLDKMYDVGY